MFLSLLSIFSWPFQSRVPNGSLQGTQLNSVKHQNEVFVIFSVGFLVICMCTEPHLTSFNLSHEVLDFGFWSDICFCFELSCNS